MAISNSGIISTQTFVFHMIIISAKETAQREGGSLGDFLIFAKKLISIFEDNMNNKKLFKRSSEIKLA